MTKVINLLGGPGCGKSTLARLISAKLSYMGYNTELVTEYCKNHLFMGLQPEGFDQLYFFAKQVRSESIKYGKVDYIVTDSPIILSAIYEHHYSGDSIIEPSMFKFFDACKKQGVEHLNFVIGRDLGYNPVGRYQDESDAIKIDSEVLQYLIKHNIEFILYDNNSELTCDKILGGLFDS